VKAKADECFSNENKTEYLKYLKETLIEIESSS
jgi:hypothetical protein